MLKLIYIFYIHLLTVMRLFSYFVYMVEYYEHNPVLVIDRVLIVRSLVIVIIKMFVRYYNLMYYYA